MQTALDKVVQSTAVGKGCPIIVTGAGGFIGGNVLQALTSKDMPVIAVDDLSKPRVQDNLKRFPTLRGVVNLRDIIDLPGPELGEALGMRRAAGVIHLGANSSIADGERPQNRVDMFKCNYEFTCQLHEAFEKQVAYPYSSAFVFASSAAVYGSDPLNMEAQVKAPDTWYGWTKSIAEEALTQSYPFRERLDAMYAVDGIYGAAPTTTILRLVNVFGPGDWTKPADIRSFITRCIEQWIANPEQGPTLYKGPSKSGVHRDFAPVELVVEAILESLVRPYRTQVPIIDVGLGTAHKLTDVARMVGEILVSEGILPSVTKVKGVSYRPSQDPSEDPSRRKGYQYFTQADPTAMRDVLNIDVDTEYRYFTDALTSYVRAYSRKEK